jgi:lipoprotein-anchoring transpeptidase ErfK/SrfK
MVLPSQSGRPISRHSYMYRRKRGRRPLVTVAVLLAVAGVIGWLWFSKGDPTPASAATEREDVVVADRGRDAGAGKASSDRKPSNSAKESSPSREQRIAMGEPVNGALLGRAQPSTAQQDAALGRAQSSTAQQDAASAPARGSSPAATSEPHATSTQGSPQAARTASPDPAKSIQPSTNPASAPAAGSGADRSEPPTAPSAPPPSNSKGAMPRATSDAMDSPAMKQAGLAAGDSAGRSSSSGSAGASPASNRPSASGSNDSAATLSAVPLEEQNRARQLLQNGLNLQAENKPVEARRMLTQAYESRALAPADEVRARQALALVSDVLVFSPSIVSGDPFASAYVVQSGDTLQKIAKPCRIEWEFLARINRMSNPRGLQINQKIKTITGPFHAIVDKDEYRLDLYLGEGSQRVFVRSFTVGLGEYNSTPVGRFKVRPRSKLKDPAWTNPRTGESFEPSDPMNPIGEFWIGLEGLDDHNKELAGYGVHGTIELDSIGQQRSMGCVRMLPDDIELIYELLMPEISTVEIRE